MLGALLPCTVPLGGLFRGVMRTTTCVPKRAAAHDDALQEDRTLYQALECCAQDAIGPGGSWAASMDSGLVNNLGE